MNLAEFVEESLTEILTGIRAAQRKEGGGAVGAQMYGTTEKLVAGGISGHFTVVDFDVSVVAENKAGGKGGLKVWGMGLEGEAERLSQHTSRVRFCVHVRIPQGDKRPLRPLKLVIRATKRRDLLPCRAMGRLILIHPDECIDCGVCEPECPVDAINADSEPELEKWLSLNAEFAKIWPNITVKKAPPPDSKEWEGKPDKLQYFSPNPGTGD
jgi:ferredoxin